MYWPLLTLILSNLVPVYGAFFLGWSIFNILLLYWFENIVIGFFNVIKMLTASNPAPVGGSSQVTLFVKLFLVGFFAVHYGIFTLSHGVLLIAVFGDNFRFETTLLWGVLSMLLSHGTSLLYNYFGKKEYEISNTALLLFSPYVRIIIMHTTILLGASLLIPNTLGFTALLILVILKTITDVIGHSFEHKLSGSTTVITPKPWAQPAFNGLLNLFSPQLEAIYRQSVASGEFDKAAKNMDPAYVDYIKKYWDSSPEVRSKMKPPIRS